MRGLEKIVRVRVKNKRKNAVQPTTKIPVGRWWLFVCVGWDLGNGCMALGGVSKEKEVESTGSSVCVSHLVVTG